MLESTIYWSKSSTTADHSFKEAVVRGLSRAQKSIDPKYLYDETGSQLFEKICQTEEYYPTRVEAGILQSSAPEISEIVGAKCAVLEIGSGSSTKTTLLLDHLIEPLAYLPLDLSEKMLHSAALRLADRYPQISVIPIVGDFLEPERIEHPLWLGANRKIAFFPGSTIGNLNPPDALQALRRIATLLKRGDYLLLGVDLIKDRAVLERAYNDRQGWTAAFNLNLISRMQREAGIPLRPETFRHRAFWNESKSRIEMHLESKLSQDILVDGRHIHFHRGESIHTENSYKYSLDEMRKLAHEAEFETVCEWTDPDSNFAVFCLGAQARDLL